MKILTIDDKWSIRYDPLVNDSPKELFRYDELVETTENWKNDQVAMFYALLQARQEAQMAIVVTNTGKDDFVVSENNVWVPGVYATKIAAIRATKIHPSLLSNLWEKRLVESYWETAVITEEDLDGFLKETI